MGEFVTKAERVVSAERLMAQIDRLAPLPQVVGDVMSVTADPDSDMRSLEAVVGRDPTVAARVFKIANSSFYSRGSQATALAEALTRVGMRSVRTMVLAASTSEFLSDAGDGYGYEDRGLWRHSLAMALTSRRVAAEVSLPRGIQEEVFLGGLVHDIGKLVLGPMLEASVNCTGYLGLRAEAVASAGLTHLEAGMGVVEHWKLPAHACDAVAYHHTLSRDASAELHAACVHVADCVLNRAAVGLRSHVVVDERIDAQALDCLSLSRTHFDELERGIRADFDEIDAECKRLM